MKGDFDVEAPNLPIAKSVSHGSLRIGFIHGHTIVPQGDPDALLIEARKMDVDVLLWGGTHRFEAYELEGKFFVNPGSATGALGTAWWAEGEEPVPSFCLMDVSFGLVFCFSSWGRLERSRLARWQWLMVEQVQGDVLVLYVYQLKKDANGVESVAVEKVTFRKTTGLAPPVAQ